MGIHTLDSLVLVVATQCRWGSSYLAATTENLTFDISIGHATHNPQIIFAADDVTPFKVYSDRQTMHGTQASECTIMLTNYL